MSVCISLILMLFLYIPDVIGLHMFHCDKKSSLKSASLLPNLSLCASLNSFLSKKFIKGFFARSCSCWKLYSFTLLMISFAQMKNTNFYCEQNIVCPPVSLFFMFTYTPQNRFCLFKCIFLEKCLDHWRPLCSCLIGLTRVYSKGTLVLLESC